LGIKLNGIVVISGASNFQTLRFGDKNDLPYICFLPTYAASARYHKQLDDELLAMPVSKVVERAERFSTGEYASVFLQGSQASERSINLVVKEMHRLTGLNETFIRQSYLRPTVSAFGKEVLREDGKTIGRFDSR